MVTRLILLLLLTAAGCASVPDGSFCAAARPIRMTATAIDAMSDAEVAAALAHNRKGETLCSWRR
jgi:hypothetical protein